MQYRPPWLRDLELVAAPGAAAVFPSRPRVLTGTYQRVAQSSAGHDTTGQRGGFSSGAARDSGRRAIANVIARPPTCKFSRDTCVAREAATRGSPTYWQPELCSGRRRSGNAVDGRHAAGQTGPASRNHRHPFRCSLVRKQSRRQRVTAARWYRQTSSRRAFLHMRSHLNSRIRGDCARMWDFGKICGTDNVWTVFRGVHRAKDHHLGSSQWEHAKRSGPAASEGPPKVLHGQGSRSLAI
jgi:hypothetical protein